MATVVMMTMTMKMEEGVKHTGLATGLHLHTKERPLTISMWC